MSEAYSNPNGSPAQLLRGSPSAYGTVYRIVSVTIRGDSGTVEVMRRYSYDPRPSTSSLTRVELRLVRTGDAWRVVSDQLLYHSFGFYDFAPLENLPPAQRAEAERLRTPVRKP